MQGRLPRIIVTVFFLGLLVAAVVLSQRTTGGGAVGVADAAAAMSRYGFRLEEVSKSVGIDFVHQAPKLDPKLAHIMPQVASMGAGVSVVDFDRDGRDDLYVTNSGEESQNRLYRNKGD